MTRLCLADVHSGGSYERPWTPLSSQIRGYLEINPNRKNCLFNFAQKLLLSGKYASEIGVTGQCFREKGSDAPVCDVHNVGLVQKELSH